MIIDKIKHYGIFFLFYGQYFSNVLCPYCSSNQNAGSFVDFYVHDKAVQTIIWMIFSFISEKTNKKS